MNKFYAENKESIQRFALYFCIAAGIYLFLKFLFPFVAPFVIGFILSLIFSPLVNFLEDKVSLPRWFGTLVAMAILFAFFSVVVVGAVGRLSEEAYSFWQNLPGYIESLQAAVRNLEEMARGWVESLPVPIQDSLDLNANMPGILETIANWISAQGNVSSSIGVVLKIPSLLLSFIFTMLAAFFFTKDRHEISAFFERHISSSMMSGYRFTMQSLSSALGGYCKAQLIIMLYIFVICIVGFFVIKSPYAFLLAVITAVVDALPFFGSGFILWPGALIHLIMGNMPMAVGYIIIYLVISLVRQLLQPKILGNQIGLHPIWSLLSLYLGWKLLGVGGLIIGPIVAVLIKAVSQLQQKKEPPELAKKS